MYSIRKGFPVVLFILPLLFGTTALASVIDDENTPEVTARVARATFIQGDVQVRRAGATDWETVTRDLPFVEGDEIATGGDSRLEVQLDSRTHFRLSENAYLQIVGLKDEGVALSVPKGIMSARILDFDNERSYFEIDAPKTTVSVRNAGMYRVESDIRNDGSVRVTVTEGGEARVYSDNSGFSLRSGRSARLNIVGPLSGEWEMSSASQYADAFDSWALDRDAAFAGRLRTANYDEYYDRDMYGAEDLNSYGEWVHTNTYGYLWRPYGSSIRGYANWSPYRYGQWRWLSPFGWTWINDEPWGWATYHYGRWIFTAGGWYWSPYGYYRTSRSWWSPALIGLDLFNDYWYWYPLPYYYAYYDYNYYWGGHRHHRGGDRNPHPTPTPTPGPGPSPTPGGGGRPPRERMPIEPAGGAVPPTGVVVVPKQDFGTGKRSFDIAPLTNAKAVLAKPLIKIDPVAALPQFEDVSGRLSRDIKPAKPLYTKSLTEAPTGAMERKAGAPLGTELQKRRIYGEREPIQQDLKPVEQKPVTRTGDKLPDTGVVQRPIIIRQPPAREIKPYEAPPPVKRVEPTYEPRKATEPRYTPPPTVQPRYDPPKPREVQPRYDPPKPVQPRYDRPMPREAPRAAPPIKEAPRPAPPQGAKPPEKSAAPKDDTQPAKPSIIEKKKEG